MSSEKRLLERITYKVTEGGCGECVSHTARRAGYPGIKDLGKLWVMHRWVYTKLKGDIPEGLVIRHTCDNRICVNPDHLLPGTQKDNFEDWLERGKNAQRFIEYRKTSIPPIRIGKDNNNTKATEQQVRTIRILSVKGGYPKRAS